MQKVAAEHCKRHFSPEARRICRSENGKSKTSRSRKAQSTTACPVCIFYPRWLKFAPLLEILWCEAAGGHPSANGEDVELRTLLPELLLNSFVQSIKLFGSEALKAGQS